MLIFVYGDDSVRIAEKVGELRSRFLSKFDSSGMNLAEFPVPGTSSIPFPEVLQAVQSSPFLAEKRMVIVRGLLDGLKKADAKQWAEGLQRTPASTIVVLVDELEAKKVEKHELFVSLKGGAEVHSYAQEKLEGSALSRMVIERAKALGASITLPVAHELIAIVGDDAWLLQREIEKLSAYAQGQPVTKEMLELLVRGSVAGNIFAFVDAVSQRNGKLALSLLEKERLAGSADLYLLAMIARQVRIVLQIRSLLEDNPNAALASSLGLHPFVVQKAEVQAKRFTLSQLLALHALLTRLDREAKRGLIDPALAVDRLVAEMVVS